MKTAQINRIITSSLVDGPGHRMTIFFQGCNLNCEYCHNPETKNFCYKCGYCSSVCNSQAVGPSGVDSYRPSLCKECHACILVCPHFSSPLYKKLTCEQLIMQINSVADWLDGITLSGGECTLQVDFILELIPLIKNISGANSLLTVFIDSNGLIEKTALEKLCKLADGFILDLKAFNEQLHINLTGQSNANIMQNALFMAKQNLLYEVRTVVIPGVNANQDEIENIAKFVLHLREIAARPIHFKLIPFHTKGVRLTKNSLLTDLTPITSSEYEQCYEWAISVLGRKQVLKTTH